MNLISGPAIPSLTEPHAEIFVRRWQAGDRSCFPKAAGILITTPYPGLRSFRRELARYFCGRETQKRDLATFFANRGSQRSATPGRMTFVVGGSGCGKSSLTRAGLIAELDSISIEGQWGAWYVAEMRPATNPIGQLQHAMWTVLCTIIDLAFLDPEFNPEPKGDFPERSAAEKGASIREASDRIRQAALEFGMEWPQDATREQVERGARHWLDREISPTEGTISTRALFDFVDDVLATFDTAASFGSRGGKPLLLLHIDQFEEIFRNECDANGRKALIGALRDIHEYKPECLFAVATMRSEELHRFSEYAGMAEVINSSMYLVDLVAGDDIGDAIVEPARRLAKLWELPLGAPSDDRLAPFTADAVRKLKEAYRQADEVLQHKADKLPLLQHMLPLVWEHAADDWIERRMGDKDAHFEIDTRHLELVAGWKAASASDEQICRLGRCLNTAADRVFVEATKAVSSAADEESGLALKEGLRTEVEGMLKVALCKLAQLDNGGQAVRKFVTLDGMLNASGGYERLPKSDETRTELRDGLKRALGKFENAGLVELLTSSEQAGADVYNVSHESLIRNWTQYAGWLKAQRNIENCLADVGPSIDQYSRALDQPGWKWLGAVKNTVRWGYMDQAEAAARLLPAASDDSLSQVFGRNAPYSLAWAGDIVGSDIRQVKVLKEAWENATWYRRTGERVRRNLKRTGLFVIGVFAVLAALLALSLGQNARLNDKLLLALQVNETLSNTGDRSAIHDRMLYWVVDKANSQYSETDIYGILPGADHRKSLLRQTIAKIDSGAREVYGNDMTIQFSDAFPPNEKAFEGISAEPAVCTPASNAAKSLVFKNNTVSGWNIPSVNQPSPNVGIESPNVGIESPNVGIDRPGWGWLCASPDGRWLLQINTTNQFAEIRRLNRAGSIVFPSLRRFPKSRESTTALTTLREEGRLFDRKHEPNVASFQGKSVVGFLIISPDRSGRDVLMWTTTGIGDPDDSMSKLGTWPLGSLCSTYQVDEPRPGTALTGVAVEKCMTGPFRLDADDKRIVIFRQKGKPGECGDYDERRADGSPCRSYIEIQYITQQEDTADPPIRARLTHLGAKITDAAIVDNRWLWLRDANRREWRYAVGMQAIQEVLALRWWGTTWKVDEKSGGIEPRLPETCALDPDCQQFIKKPDASWPAWPEEKVPQ